MDMSYTPKARQCAEAVCAATTPDIESPVEFVREFVLDLARELRVSTRLQCSWLACLLGGPDEFDPCWRTHTAVAMATAVYAEQDFDRLPILADSLEEAGATVAVGHLRGPGPHVRGCWVMDGLPCPPPP
jgi:hypothetical protein